MQVDQLNKEEIRARKGQITGQAEAGVKVKRKASVLNTIIGTNPAASLLRFCDLKRSALWNEAAPLSSPDFSSYVPGGGAQPGKQK